ncbi:MAG: FAD-dependent oxidoreductase [Treponema sp.]|jgi:hypothetical protein|nr:FAD-dependent oxidoreductase [Treponema sp.]
MAIKTERIVKIRTLEVVNFFSEKPALLSADILVIGMGAAGVMAALQAARLGRTVVAADSSFLPGGQAVNANIGLFCGLYSKTTPHYLYTYGIAEDLLHDLDVEEALYYRDSGVTIAVAYDEQAYLRWIDSNMIKENVMPVIGVAIDKVERAGRRLKAVEFLGRFGRVRVEASFFIDASGDAALAWNAGLACRVSGEGPVYGTQMIVVDNVDLAKLPGEQQIKERILEKAAEFGIERHDGIVFFFPQKNRLILNMTHLETPLDPVAFSRSAITGRERADRALRFMRSEYPDAFGDATVHAYGLPGIRQTRWIKGKKQLAAEDVRAGIFFDDAIGRTTWPIELHDTLATHQWEPFADDHVHYVPFGAMIPPDVDNLVAAGRCIDADLIALSSVRVMGPCMAMGMAAAHAADLAGGGSVHDVEIKVLQERIKDNLYRRDELDMTKVKRSVK